MSSHDEHNILRNKRWWAAAFLLIAAFVFLQVQTIDYGTLINDFPDIANYKITSDVTTGSSLDRNVIAGKGAGENLDRWMMRYKLYSIDADEAINIMALARIKPAQGAFDPHFYVYGGAWIYPLGGWYLLLTKLTVLELAPLNTLLSEPDRMDAIYSLGRLFTLLAFSASAIIMFRILLYATSPVYAFIGLAIYLAAPASVLFSVVMKPHWYALIWINLAIFVVVKGCYSRSIFSSYSEMLLGFALGLAVGTVFANGLFSVFIWFALVGMVLHNKAGIRSLFLVPVVAVIMFIVSNPYLILNWNNYYSSISVTSSWFTPEISLSSLWGFIENSLATEFGITVIFCLIFVCIKELRRPTFNGARFLFLGVIAVIVIISTMTSVYSHWHTNVRYVIYLWPVIILCLSAAQWPGKKFIYPMVLVLTVLQAMPISVAKMDENDPHFSTRIRAANWIAVNVPSGEGVCIGTKTPAPYNTPPINFLRYEINEDNCPYLIRVEPQQDFVIMPENYSLTQRFTPRFTQEKFPLVFNHLNAQFSVYRRD